MTGLPGRAFKCVLRGTIRNTQSWSCGIWIEGTSSPADPDVAAVAGEVRDLAHVWAGVVSDYWTTETKFTGVDAYYYAPGTTVALNVANADDPSPVSGSHSTNRLPTYVSLVQTLRTGLAGRSFRGRIYVPITSAALGSAGQMPASDVQVVATATRDMLSDINDLDLTADGLAAHSCVVASFTRSLATPINSVYCDSLMDVQHRREDKIGADAWREEFIV